MVDGGLYHVFNRGNDRRRLFSEASDYQHFLGLLGRFLKLYQAPLYHYCLMPNHFHFLLKIQKKDDLSTLMHRLQLSYARYFKKAYRFVGHVFQERFRSPRISEESYYLQCGRYIERNPVSAKLVDLAQDHPYSSAPYYVRGAPNDLVTPNPYYLEMGFTQGQRQQAYSRFLMLEDPYAPMVEEVLAKV